MVEWWLLFGICSTEFIPNNLFIMTICKVYSFVMHFTDPIPEPYIESDFAGVLLVAAEEHNLAVNKESMPAYFNLLHGGQDYDPDSATDFIKE